MRKLLLLGAMAALVLGASADSASAETWSGSCSFKGVGTFKPPYSYVVANRNYVARGSGGCRGKLNRRSYNGPAHIYLDGRMNAPMSCELGATPGTIVPGTLTLARDPRRVNAPRVGLSIANVHSLFVDHFVVQGAYNGEAFGQWFFNVSVGTLSTCLPSNGLRTLKFSMTLRTIRPLYG